MSFVLLLELSHFAKLFHFREYAANIEDAIFLSNRLSISRLDSVNSIIAFLSFLFSDLLDNLHDEGRLVGLLPELVLLHLDHHPGVDQKGLFGTHTEFIKSTAANYFSPLHPAPDTASLRPRPGRCRCTVRRRTGRTGGPEPGPWSHRDCRLPWRLPWLRIRQSVKQCTF